MKKLLLILSLCLSILIAYPASVTYHWNAIDNPITAGGLPPKYLRLYYGSSHRNYTNHVDCLITNINTTNVYRGYDQYNCVWMDVRNYVTVKVTGLVLSQQVYSAYSVINSNGVESSLINESSCAYIVTNNSDAIILPPVNFRITSVK